MLWKSCPSGFAKRRTPMRRFDFSIGTFPDNLDLRHVSRLMDDPDPISRFRSFDTPMTEILCQLKTPVADIPMGRSIPATCLHKRMAQIHSWAFSLEIPDFLDLETLRYPECRYPDKPTLFRDFHPPVHEALNLVQLLNRSDGCRVSWTQDLMVRSFLPVLLLQRLNSARLHPIQRLTGI
jgi:hypothetical protein